MGDGMGDNRTPDTDYMFDGFRAGEHDPKPCRHVNSVAANMAGGAWCPKCGAFRANVESAWCFPVQAGKST